MQAAEATLLTTLASLCEKPLPLRSRMAILGEAAHACLGAAHVRLFHVAGSRSLGAEGAISRELGLLFTTHADTKAAVPFSSRGALAAAGRGRTLIYEADEEQRKGRRTPSPTPGADGGGGGERGAGDGGVGDGDGGEGALEEEEHVDRWQFTPEVDCPHDVICRNALHVPIEGGGGDRRAVLGCVQVLNKVRDNRHAPFDDDDVTAASAFAALAGLILECKTLLPAPHKQGAAHLCGSSRDVHGLAGGGGGEAATQKSGSGGAKARSRGDQLADALFEEASKVGATPGAKSEAAAKAALLKGKSTPALFGRGGGSGEDEVDDGDEGGGDVDEADAPRKAGHVLGASPTMPPEAFRRAINEV